MFDIKKITSSPKNEFEAMKALSEKEQQLISALFILHSIEVNSGDEFKEIHLRNINEFLSKFKS